MHETHVWKCTGRHWRKTNFRRNPYHRCRGSISRCMVRIYKPSPLTRVQVGTCCRVLRQATHQTNVLTLAGCKSLSAELHVELPHSKACGIRSRTSNKSATPAAVQKLESIYNSYSIRICQVGIEIDVELCFCLGRELLGPRVSRWNPITKTACVHEATIKISSTSKLPRNSRFISNHTAILLGAYSCRVGRFPTAPMQR